MTIAELYDSLTPIGYFALVVGILFLVGLFLGWCLWWWGSRRWPQVEPQFQSAKQEVEELRSANQALEANLIEKEKNAKEGLLGSSSTSSSTDQSSAVRPAEVNWNELPNIDASLAAELEASGFHNVDQLESLSPDERHELESKLASKGHSWDWGWLGTWKTTLASAGGIAAATGAVGASYWVVTV